MGTEFEVPDGNRPRSEGTGIGRLAGWLLGLVGLNTSSLDEFADRLAVAFRSGLEVTHPASGVWFATLDAIAPEDNQVAALVRLSSERPERPREVRRGVVDVEERNRELFAEPARVALPADEDLLLTYSFPLLLSLDQNLELFREFAGNELGRLRGREAFEIVSVGMGSRRKVPGN